MRELTINIPSVNASKLDSELHAALNSKYDSLSTYGVGRAIIVRLVDGTTPTDDATVAAVCAAHDPTPLPNPLVVDLTQAKTDAGSTPLDGITVQQAVDYINTNVTNLASAKTALIYLVKYIGVQERRLRLIERQLGL